MRLDFVLIGAMLFGFLCFRQAKKKDRTTIVWFYLGFLFGMFALITLYFLKKPIKIEPKKIILPIADDNYWYYIDKDSQQIGPFSAHAILKKFFNSEIFNNTYLWNDTMENWKKLHEIETFSSYLNNIEITS